MKLKITVTDKDTHFYGRGKLLITSEYFVLNGAEALAIPTKFGQHLKVRQLQSNSNMLFWVALGSDGNVWLSMCIDRETLLPIGDAPSEATILCGMLSAIRKMEPDFLTQTNDTAIETRLDFPQVWGLGSSSTLIHCLAEWSGVNAYKLLQETIGGSGYDLACAAADSAILYTLNDGQPNTMQVNWKPLFSENIFFAYTGKKQISRTAIEKYRQIVSEPERTINQLNNITHAMLKCESLETFEQLVNEHENIIGAQLKMVKVKETMFSDYWGSVKSLGAWGGDFVMLTNNRTREELYDYLKVKNITTVFSWNELLISAKETPAHSDNSLKLPL